MTAARCRRLPLSRIRVLSGGRPRKLAGRTRVAASSIGMVLTLNDGTSTFSWSSTSVEPWLCSSSALMMSIGTAESVAERALLRVPSTETDSSVAASSLSDAGAFCAITPALKASRAIPLKASFTPVASGFPANLRRDPTFMRIDSPRL
jgi:hypothetical protein